MITLIIDTSKAEALLLLDQDGQITKRSWTATSQLGSQLLVLLDEILAENSLSLAQIDRLAVHRGPGHFSALRTGLVIATMLAEVSQKELVSISGDDQKILLQQARESKPVEIIEPTYIKK